MNLEWDPAAEANHMTKVADGIYEIEYTLGEYDTSDPEFKFAINDAWTHNFGLGDNGVIENGVTTDAIYNGSKNLKITGLTAGTTIKMQLDLTGFDFDTKTGAKMTITWTAPAEQSPPRLRLRLRLRLPPRLLSRLRLRPSPLLRRLS